LKIQLVKDLVQLPDQVVHLETVEFCQRVLHQQLNLEANLVEKRMVVARIDLAFVQMSQVDLKSMIHHWHGLQQGSAEPPQAQDVLPEVNVVVNAVILFVQNVVNGCVW
jgi:hypothetical protein